MPRGYRRSGSARRSGRYSRLASTRSRYSIETSINSVQYSNGSLGAPADGSLTGSFPVVPASTVQGMRKVKHMQVTVTLSHSGSGSSSSTPVSAESVAALAAGCPVLWAMVYVPAGFLTDTQTLQPPAITGSLYEPNQFVICSGIADPNAGPIRINTPLARNLNSGDSIHLIFRIVNGQQLRTLDPEGDMFCMCRYAITLN